MSDLRARLDQLAHMTEARDNARAEVGRLTALVEAVREIHAPEHHPRGFAYCGECSGDEFARYPCNTLDALDGRIES